MYLEPDEHRRLVAEARARGISLAALLRDIVAAHARERAAPYEPRGFEAIIRIADGGEPTDIARREDDYKREAWAHLSMQPPAKRRQRAGKPGRRKPR